MQTALALVVFVLVLLFGLHVMAARQFRARILGLAARLHDAPPMQAAEDGLPAPVAEFARRAGAGTSGRFRVATYAQDGELRLKRGGGFTPVTAWQAISLGRAGFLWDARAMIGPFPRMRILDAYVGGEGVLEARLFGSVPVARATGGDLTLGEAFRYLAELPWAPDAIIGNRDLVWRMTGGRSAEVRMQTAEGTARVSFLFDAQGDIVAMEAKGRPARTADGAMQKLDWRGRFGDYREIGERRLPGTGEVGYVYPEGYEVYYRARIRDYRLGV